VEELMHDYHEGLPGYHPDQILVDGCGECEARGGDVENVLAHLDPETFRRAWSRANALNTGGTNHISAAEALLLRSLWLVQRQLRSLVITDPIHTEDDR
jgi:hypothetical protein